MNELLNSFDSIFTLADAAAGPDGLKWWIDFLLHLDDKLKELVKDWGVWTHWILFAVIFCETGLVVTPFLPGDSLLFAAGAFAADRSLRMEWLIPLLILAAILGDTVNYSIGYWIGARALNGKIPFVKKASIDRTHAFFETYGPKTIILARFIPIVRTFAPFVAGIGSMSYRQFAIYNIVGSIVWVIPLLMAGYWFGRFEFVQKNFELVVLGIVFLSILPMFFEWRAHRSRGKKPPSSSTPPQPEVHPAGMKVAEDRSAS